MSHIALDNLGDQMRLLEGDVARGLADDRGAVFEQDGGWRQHFTFDIGKRDRLAAVVERGDGGKCRPQVDADEFAGGGHEVARENRNANHRYCSDCT